MHFSLNYFRPRSSTRIHESKEIPTANVIDPANFPEKKSFPSPPTTISPGIILFFAGAVAWVIGLDNSEHLDSNDPRKELALQTKNGATARLSIAARFGAVNQSHVFDRVDQR